MTSAQGGEGGVPEILIFADRVGVQKGPKYTDVILEQPLRVITVNLSGRPTKHQLGLGHRLASHYLHAELSPAGWG